MSSHPADDPAVLPPNLPEPVDDGAAVHLVGLTLPAITLPSTPDAEPVDLSRLGAGRSVVYFYPLSARPGTDLPDGWESIPGARGCTAEACAFRDDFALLRGVGVRNLFGVSSQDTAYQAELAQRLALPFPMLSDAAFELADALRLPTFAAPGHPRLHSRLTLVVRDGVIEHVFYPVFPPDGHADAVAAWLQEHPDTSSSS